MAMISPYKDYELTRSLMKLNMLYYQTKCERDDLERDIKYKEERMAAIRNRMCEILSTDDEWKIMKNNYLTYDSSQPVINFVERMLDTHDDEKVMRFINETDGLTERDSRYTKGYWEQQLKESFK